MSAAPIIDPVYLPHDTLQLHRPRLQFIALGDSITQNGDLLSPELGYLTLLRHTYIRKADIINRGYSGYNSELLYHTVQQSIQNNIWNINNMDQSPVVYTIMIGTNDAVLPKTSTQHIPLLQYKANVVSLIGLLKSYHRNNSQSCFIVLITPPYTEPWRWAKYCQIKHNLTELPPIQRSAEHTEQYVDMLIDIASQQNLPCINLYVLTQSNHNSTDVDNIYLSDGLHLSSAGNHLLYTMIIDVINKNHPELSNSKCALDAPVWTVAAEQLGLTNNR